MSGWKEQISENARPIALIFLSLAAILPLHVVGFQAALERPFSRMLTVGFKFEMSTHFTLLALFAFFVTRVVLDNLMSLETTVRVIWISRLYKKRGYSRANPIFFRSKNNDESIDESFVRINSMTRSDARYENFVKKKVRSSAFIENYERMKWISIVSIGLVLLSYLYLGIARGSLMIFIILILMITARIYDEYRDEYFWNLSGYRSSTFKEALKRYSINLNATVVLLSVVSTSSFIAGYLRCSYLMSANEVAISAGSIRTSGSVVAMLSNGVIFYDEKGENLLYVSNNNLSIRPIEM